MKYLIDKESRPFYLELYRKIRDDIVSGHYPYLTKLPSKRSLAAETGVSTITVEHAYALLCDEGYVESHERSGFIVIFRTQDGFALSGEQHYSHPVRYKETELPDFPLSVLNKTIRKILTNQSERLLEKSPGCGCMELRLAIRLYLARNRGIKIEPEQIVIGSGSEYLYRLIAELLGRHKVYAIEYPSYKKIEQVYRAAGIRYEPLPLTNSGIDSRALSETSASVLHTTPFRSYPSGVTATASKRHEYIRWAGQNNRYIIEDDFESEFSVSSRPAETLFTLSGSDNIIYLNSFSKTISPSFRIAYMVLPRHLVSDFNRNLGFYSCTVPSLMQYILTELINNGDFERHINRVRRKKRKELSVNH